MSYIYDSIMLRLSDFDDRDDALQRVARRLADTEAEIMQYLDNMADERNLETMNGEVVHALIADKIGHVFRRNC